MRTDYSKDEIQNALDTLRNGGVLLYPTDTVWGLGCDASDDQAIDKILRLKKRSGEKGFIVLIDSDNRLQRIVKEVPEVAWDIIDNADSPTTIIYPEGYNVSQKVLGERGSIAVRIVNEGFCQDMLRKFGKAVVSTSANLTNMPAPESFNDIDKSIIESADYVVKLKGRENKNKKPSNLIQLGLTGQIKILR